MTKMDKQHPGDGLTQEQKIQRITLEGAHILKCAIFQFDPKGE
jgi:hypothetical protein